MSNRAFDTSKLGAGYGFESFPQRKIEMPPTWAILFGLAFLVCALMFWVSIECDRSYKAILTAA